MSWTEGAFLHFALYQTKDGSTTSGAQVAFRVTDIADAHERVKAAGAELVHGPFSAPIVTRGGPSVAAIGPKSSGSLVRTS